MELLGLKYLALLSGYLDARYCTSPTNIQKQRIRFFLIYFEYYLSGKEGWRDRILLIRKLKLFFLYFEEKIALISVLISILSLQPPLPLQSKNY